MRTVVIGIDGLGVRHLDRDASSMPTITGLCDRGIEARLESTHPPSVGCAWPSLYTGCEPSHHGVYGSLTYDAYPSDPQPASRIDVRRPAMWDYLSSEGTSSVVLNVPVTQPADPMNGVLVPGDSPAGTEPAHPMGIRDELADERGDPFTEPPTDERTGVETLVDSVDRRRRAVSSLLERTDWELAVVRLDELETAVGEADDASELEPLYQAVDAFVGGVLETVGEETNVVCCSTRGVSPVAGYRIAINEILREVGFLEPTDGGEPPTPSFQIGQGDGREHRGPIERALRAGDRVMARFGLESTLAEFVDGSSDSTNDRIDWYSSIAYCPDETCMGVRINLAGREPYGNVPPSRYESVCDELVELLTALETPDGEPAFEFVCRRDHLHEGHFFEGAPDVCFLPKGMNHTVSAALSGRRFESIDTVGLGFEGVFVGTGPGFTGTAPTRRLSLVDVAPITMALLGRPVPSLMTGSVPDGLLVDPAVRARYDDLVYGAAATDPLFDDGDVGSRLEDAGYL
ncbi:alkaline phosphatase family protein [Natronobeatus ordinarius]|uniref:alkaline phosphatase family protein n=1 Tax=Natronobeatus ordinarius TaxID=2963433 RepID=UPI0020CF8E69|nr:alkaline phosphatase family protein [Natronobeatus ordinarius]